MTDAGGNRVGLVFQCVPPDHDGGHEGALLSRPLLDFEHRFIVAAARHRHVTVLCPRETRSRDGAATAW
jgi:hypothetical protein